MTGVSELFAGGVILTALAAGWRYVKLFLGRLVGLLVRRVEVEKGTLSTEVLGLLVQRMGLPRVRDSYYEQYWDWSRATRENRHFAMERLGIHPMLFRKGWRFVLLLPPGSGSSSGNRPVGDTVVAVQESSSAAMTLLFLRGTIDADELVADAAAAASSRTSSVGPAGIAASRFSVFRFPSGGGTLPGRGEHRSEADLVGERSRQWHSRVDIRRVGDLSEVGYMPLSPDTALSRLYYPPHVRVLIEDIRRWRDSKEWHEERGLPWRRGWNLYGGPGTGKTSLARAFAIDLRMPLFVFALGELANDQFLDHWSTISHSTPCVAVFEDIDNVFHGREPVNSLDPFESGLFGPVQAPQPVGAAASQDASSSSRRLSRVVQFDTLLNCIDGVDRGVSEGIFTIITTNRIEMVDPALGGPGPDGVPRVRPGRIDRVVELGPICRDGKRELLARIAAGCPRTLESISAELDACIDPVESPAQFEFRVGQMALEEFMRGGRDACESNGHARLAIAAAR